MNQFAKRVVVALFIFLVIVQTVAIAQNLGAAPQVNVAVQGQTGRSPKARSSTSSTGSVTSSLRSARALRFWALSVAMQPGEECFRWLVTAAGLLAISGLTRLIEFWIAQGGGGIS